ncbi:MAG: hypothetical protein ACLPUG_03465 [Acidimicrobiales bacterium]
MRKLGAIATVAMTLMLAAWSGSSAYAVARSGVSLPRATTSSSGETGCSAAKPASFAQQSVAGLFETDLTTHQRFKAVRSLAVDNPDLAVIAGGDLFLTYGGEGNSPCTRIARVPLSGGPAVQSAWLNLSSPLTVAYGSVWVLGFPSPKSADQILYQLAARTLSVERQIQVGTRFGGWAPAASAGALWLSPSNGTELERVDARTARLTIVQLPGFRKGQSVLDVVSGPGADTLYISAIDQMAATWSQSTERFHPETGQFEVAASNERFPIVRLIGVAGTLLWVWTAGGNMSHVAPASAATMAPLHCSIENTCTFDGLNGIFDVTTAGSLAWMSHAGGWLECAGGPTGSVRATVRVPGYGSITDGYSGNDSGPSSLAVGDGYLAVNAQFRGAHGTDLSPEVAIFPIDPRCAR